MLYIYMYTQINVFCTMRLMIILCINIVPPIMDIFYISNK